MILDKQEIESLRKRIESGEIIETLTHLKKALNGTYLLNEILLLNSRLNNLSSQTRKGVIESSAAFIESNKITIAVLELLTELETGLFEVPFNDPIERAAWLAEKKKAEQLIVFLEDRRVLFVGYDDEGRYVKDSLSQIRERLSQYLETTEFNSQFSIYLTEMRTIVRNFIQKYENVDLNELACRLHQSGSNLYDTYTEPGKSLREIRLVFANCLEKIAQIYEIELDTNFIKKMRHKNRWR